MSGRPLAGLRVADLADCVAGQFAARLFADNGADVVLVETAQGSRTRAIGPFDTAGESLLFRHLNVGKWLGGRHQDPTSALGTIPGSDSAPSITDWDVIIVSDPTTAELVGSRWPGACVATVTDFAADGPYAHWLGGELIHQALSGSMYYNGRATGKPLYGTGYRADYAAGLQLYIRSLAEILGPPSARSGRVRVTRHEAATAMEQNFSTQWAYSRTLAARGEWNRPKGRVRCRDGWLIFFASGHSLRELFAALCAADVADDPRFANWHDFVRNIATATAIFNERSRDLTRQEALLTALRDRLVLSPVRELADLAADEQLIARDFWRRDGRGRLTLGPVWRHDHPSASSQATAVRRLAPAEPRWATDDAATGPLTGIRVVDLTSAWSGPMATRILAALGAEVIKVEGPNRMDGWRGDRTSPWHLDSYPDSTAGPRPFNRNAWFNTQNQGKLSVGIDLKNPKGRGVALDLIAQSDVVIANFSPGTLARLGLGIDDVRAVNPRIAVVEMSGFGDSGPLRDHRGLGQTMEAMSGITSLIGYADEDEPLGSGSAYLDPMGGLAGAAAVVTALARCRRDHTAERVEVPQREAAMHWIGEQILAAVESGCSPRPAGNRRDGACPHDAFPALGDDEWIAVATYEDDQWSALCRTLGWSDWANDECFRGVPARMARREEIDTRLASITRRRDKHELAATLQQAGIPAAPVQNGPDLFDDPQLRSRRWFTARSHPEVGCRDHPGVAVEINGSLARPRQAAPLFAEHTTNVLSRMLGYTPTEIDELMVAGVVVGPFPIDDREPTGEQT